MRTPGKNRVATRADAIRRLLDDTPTVQRAIQAIKDHLDIAWITEGCADPLPVEGCWSCRAVMLKRELEAFEAELEDDASPSTRR